MVTGIHILLFSWSYFTFLVCFKVLSPCTPLRCKWNGANITYAPSLLSEPLKERITLLLITLFTWGFQNTTSKNLIKKKIQRQHGRFPVTSQTYYLSSHKLRPKTKLIYILALTVLLISHMTSEKLFAFLCLSFLIYKMGLMLVYISQGYYEYLVKICKVLKTGPGEP